MIEYLPFGDAALILKAGDDISPRTHSVIRQWLGFLDKTRIEGVLDLIPSYNELLLCYDPAAHCFDELTKHLRALEGAVRGMTLPPVSVIEVPAAYGGEHGPDLPETARRTGLQADEVVRIHSATDYLVYMLGFTPGFCYLGGMNERLAAQRKESPRLKVPAGSVGIAGRQTGIYSIDSPGGWQIIGRTPLKFFDPARKPEFPVNPGDYIRFVPVDSVSFEKIRSAVTRGTYRIRRSLLKT